MPASQKSILVNLQALLPLKDCHATEQSLRDRIPSPHERVEPLNLAVVLHTLRGRRGDVYLDASTLTGALERLPTPATLETTSNWARWEAGRVFTAPDPGGLQAPRFEGDVLVFDEIGAMDFEDGHPVSLPARTVRVRFAPDTWEWMAEEHALSPRASDDVQARVEALFGARVDGFSRVDLESAALFVAYGATPGAAHYAWKPRGADPSRHASFADLAAAHPEVLEREALVELAQTFLRHIDSSGHSVIADPEGWLQQYQTNGWDEHTTHSYHEGVRPKTVRTYVITDEEALTPPSVEQGTLVLTTFAQNNQPYRLTLPLDALTLGDPFTFTPLAQGSITYQEDDEGRPMIAPGPTPEDPTEESP